MSYSINHNHAKIEVENIQVSTTHITINATFYFDNNFMLFYSASYTHANFNQAQATADAEAAWNAANANKSYELLFRATKPSGAYIDTPNAQF